MRCRVLVLRFGLPLKVSSEKNKFGGSFYVVGSRVVRRAHSCHRVRILNGLVDDAYHANVAECVGGMDKVCEPSEELLGSSILAVDVKASGWCILSDFVSFNQNRDFLSWSMGYR